MRHSLPIVIAAALCALPRAYAAPTVAQCAAATSKLYIAGSSSAGRGIVLPLSQVLFDSGGTTTISATNGDFRAWCGVARAGNPAGLPTASVVAVYFRGEGGTLVGTVPLVSGTAIKFLDISTAACQVAQPVTTGTSSSVGSTDGWGGCVTAHTVEMGITDLEPAQFVAPNNPSGYSTAVFGSASPSQITTWTRTFSQVFGVYVNTTGMSHGPAGQPINLTREIMANILNGYYTDWSEVPSASGLPMSSNPVPIVVVNQVAGSGARTAASIYFLGSNCTKHPLTLFSSGPANEVNSQSEALAIADANPGAITYATIDNSSPHLTLASLHGVLATNRAAASSGYYEFWFEGTAQKGAITSAGGTEIYNWLTTSGLRDLATAPHAAHINAIPPDVNTLPIAASTVGAFTIYLNPYTRGGDSCDIPLATNQ